MVVAIAAEERAVLTCAHGDFVVARARVEEIVLGGGVVVGAEGVGAVAGHDDVGGAADDGDIVALRAGGYGGVVHAVDVDIVCPVARVNRGVICAVQGDRIVARAGLD